MKKLIILFAFIFTSGLVLTQKKQNRKVRMDFSFIEKVLAATTIDLDNTNTSTAAGRADMARAFYMIVNGPIVDEDGTVEFELADGPGSDTDDTSDDGLLGLVSSILGPNGIGQGLAAVGVNECSEVPNSGSESFSTDDGTFTLTFESPSENIPDHFPNDAGETFEKRVAVDLDGTPLLNAELNCTGSGTLTSGWLRFDSDESGSTRALEMYFQHDSSSNLVFVDFFMTFDGSSSDEKLALTFETSNGEDYKLHLIRTEDSSNDNSASIGIVGSRTSTTSTARINYIFDTVFNNTDSISGAQDFTECMDLIANSTTTGCSAMTEPSIDGSFSNGLTDWTINDVHNNMTLTTIN